MTGPRRLDDEGGPADVADPMRETWRSELADVGGESPLLHFVDSPTTRIELSTTHPGGLAQFITGKTTLLSNLIRDDIALRTARIAADRDRRRRASTSSRRAVSTPMHLGIGIVEWRYDDAELLRALLLRPLAIRRHGRDFELRCAGDAVLNPALRAPRSSGSSASRSTRAPSSRSSDEDGTFKPNAGHRPAARPDRPPADFIVQPRLVVSSFAEVAPALLADAADLEHPVLDALAGNPTAKWAIEEGYTPVEPIESGPPRPVDRRAAARCRRRAGERRRPDRRGQLARRARRCPAPAGPRPSSTRSAPWSARTSACSWSAPAARLCAASPSASPMSAWPASPSRRAPCDATSSARSPATRKPRSHTSARSTTPSCACARCCSTTAARSPAPDDVLGVSRARLRHRAVAPRAAAESAPHDGPAQPRRRRGARDATGAERRADAWSRPRALGEFRYGPGDSPWYGAQLRHRRGRHRARTRSRSACTRPSCRGCSTRAQELIGRRACARSRPSRSSASTCGCWLDIRDTLDKFLPVGLRPVAQRTHRRHRTATRHPRDVGREPSSPEEARQGIRAPRRARRRHARGAGHDPAAADPVAALRHRRRPAGGAGRHRRRARRAASRSRTTSRSSTSPLGLLARATASSQTCPIDALVEKITGLAADSDVLTQPAGAHCALVAPCATLISTRSSPTSPRGTCPRTQVAAELELAWWQSRSRIAARRRPRPARREHERARPARGGLPAGRRGARRG